MAALERRVGGDAPAAAGAWLVALVAERRDAAEEAAAGRDLDAIVATAEEGDGGSALPREEIEQQAAQRAAEQSRQVAAAADIAGAILDAQSAPAAREPEAGEPEGPPEAPQQAETPSLPLSFAVEQLLASLIGGEGDAADLHELVASLLEQHRDAAEEAQGEIDLAALETAIRELLARGERGGRISRDDLVRAASGRARERGRSVVAGPDLAFAILEAGGDIASSNAAEPAEQAAPVVTSEERTPSAQASPRAIRVFVSSTFRDMQAERDELTLRVFPQLRKLCEQRGVTWGEVDLRWGITEEEAEEGKVLPICLAQIERCRPYFIGLLGERYGWVPEEIEPDLIERQPWLKERLERSVTELEIDYGVLLNPEMADHAFFYLRDPAYLDSLPERERAEYLERASREEIEEHGKEEAERRAEARRDKLAALKEQLLGSELPVEEDYPDPKALGELVLRDIGAVIDKLYPEGSEPDPLEREAAEHEAFAQSRAAVYVGRSAYFERLDAHAAGEGAPLVVLGESGSGKSALLANWALRYREAHPEELVVMHFIGSSPQSSDWRAMLRRAIGELGRRFGIEAEIPDDPAELSSAFANYLHIAATRGKVVLILDALNQLEDREGAPELVWLPPEIPPNVRLVLSTLPGRPLEEVGRRGWPTLRVEPLERGEREQLITEYLRQYARALDRPQLERIATAPQSANPLYVRALLEELRLWGEHETLGQRIEHYLAAEAIDDLYELILERYEGDYEEDRPGLARDAMSLIWAARRGLSEAELLDLLGAEGKPLPSVRWSPLYLAAEQSLASRSGLLGFSHDYLRRAVRDRYLPDGGSQAEAHLRLAEYFDSRREEPRGVDELPWQLAEAASWQRLYELLADLDFFGRAWKANESDVRSFWALIEAGSSLRMADAYPEALEQPELDWSLVWPLTTLLGDAEYFEEALGLARRLAAHHEEAGNQEDRVLALEIEADILGVMGERGDALKRQREIEALCRELDDRAGLARSLITQAGISSFEERYAESAKAAAEAERLGDELDDAELHDGAMNTRAMAELWRGRPGEAMTLLRQLERSCRERGDRLLLAYCLMNQSAVLNAQGAGPDALAPLADAEQLCREMGLRRILMPTLRAKASIESESGNEDAAIALTEEAERLCRDLGDKASLQDVLHSRAAMLYKRGERDAALELWEEQGSICRELGLEGPLQTSLANQAGIFESAKTVADSAHALALREEQEAVDREIGDKARQALASSLSRQATMLINVKRPDDAKRRADEALDLARELGMTKLTEEIEAVLEYIA